MSKLKKLQTTIDDFTDTIDELCNLVLKEQSKVEKNSDQFFLYNTLFRMLKHAFYATNDCYYVIDNYLKKN